MYVYMCYDIISMDSFLCFVTVYGRYDDVSPAAFYQVQVRYIHVVIVHL